MGLASSAKGLLDNVRGVDPGQNFLTSLSTMGGDLCGGKLEPGGWKNDSTGK